jgi:A/G-specific adenine glycosylase
MVKDFGNRIINWYEKNKRSLPWRNTSDPYKIWLSEIILQQTRVEQGMAYYLKFVHRFPDIFSLEQAGQDEIYKMWQGLGYYNRANNLMAAAKTIVHDFQGIFPETPEELIRIKGIGPYTAAAISSIAFNYPKAVVDGNVFRVLSRIFDISSPINTGKGKQVFELLAGELMVNKQAGTFNQAVMEFGALHCKPKNPDCAACIFFNDCLAARFNKVDKLPVKNNKTKVKNRYFYYLFIEVNGRGKTSFYLKQRDKKDIWKNLYDFPVLESETRLNPEDVLESRLLKTIFKGIPFTLKSVSAEYRHQLTHQKIHAVFFRIIVNKNSKYLSEKQLLLVNENKLIHYPVPRLLERYLQDQEILKSEKWQD